MMTADVGRRSHVLVCLHRLTAERGEDGGPSHHLRVCATEDPRTTLDDVRSAYGGEEAVKGFEVFYDVGSMLDRLLGDMAWKRFDDAVLAPAFAGIIWHLRDVVDSDAETFFRDVFLPFVRRKFAAYLEDTGERDGKTDAPLTLDTLLLSSSSSASGGAARDDATVAVRKKRENHVVPVYINKEIRGFRFVDALASLEGRGVVLTADHLLDLVVKAEDFRSTRRTRNKSAETTAASDTSRKKSDGGYRRRRERVRKEVEETWEDRRRMWDVPAPFLLPTSTFGQTYPYLDSDAADARHSTTEQNQLSVDPGVATVTFEPDAVAHHRGFLAPASFVTPRQAMDLAQRLLKDGGGGKGKKGFVDAVTDATNISDEIGKLLTTLGFSVDERPDEEIDACILKEPGFRGQEAISVSGLSHALVPPSIGCDFFSPSAYSFDELTAYDTSEACCCPLDLVKTWNSGPSDTLTTTDERGQQQETTKITSNRLYVNEIDRKIHVASLRDGGGAAVTEYDRLPEFVCVSKVDVATKSPHPPSSYDVMASLMDGLKGAVLDARNVALLRRSRDMLGALISMHETGEAEVDDDEDFEEGVVSASASAPAPSGFEDQQFNNTKDFVATRKNDEAATYANEVVEHVYEYLVSRKTKNIRRSRIPKDLVFLGVNKVRKAKGYAYGLELAGGLTSLASGDAEDLRKPIDVKPAACVPCISAFGVGTRLRPCHDLRPDPVTAV